MKAIVNEIQVCGGRIFRWCLADACVDFADCVEKGIDREKLNFSITCTDGKVRHITIRQEDDQVVAYGDFEGLPDALEYAQDVMGVQYKEE